MLTIDGGKVELHHHAVHVKLQNTRDKGTPREAVVNLLRKTEIPRCTYLKKHAINDPILHLLLTMHLFREGSVCFSRITVNIAMDLSAGQYGANETACSINSFCCSLK